MAATWLSEAKNCKDMVAAPKRVDRATPARISPCGPMPRTMLKASMIRAALSEPARAPMATVLSPARPPASPPARPLATGRMTMEKLAPKAAPCERPRVKDEASGLLSTFCSMVPVRARDAPTARAAQTLGKRRWRTK